MLVLRDGRPEVPGGTREPGESIEATLQRELMEEGGGDPGVIQAVWGVGLRFDGGGAVPAALAASEVSAAGGGGSGGIGNHADDWRWRGCG